MLSQVNPVGAGVAAPNMNRVNDVGVPSASAAPGQSASSSQSAASPLEALSTFSQLMNQLGGSDQNNRLLEMLFALVVLLALLDQQFGGQESTSQALGNLGRGMESRGGDSQQPFTFSYASTSISMTQTVAIFEMPAQSTGSQLDTRA